MNQSNASGKLFHGALPVFPLERKFGDIAIFLIMAIVMSFGVGAFAMMLLAPLAKAGLGLVSVSVRDFVFVANADVVAATSRLLAHAMDCGAALMFLWTFLAGKPLGATLSINVQRLRFGWVQALLLAVAGFALQRGLCWLIYDVLALVQTNAGESGGALVKTASQLSGAAMVIMMVQTLVCAPILEEIVFRGFVYNILRSSLRNTLPGLVWLAEVLACLLGALLFTALHVTAAGALLPIFIGAVILNELYRRTGSLICPILMHVMLNGAVWYSILSH